MKHREFRPVQELKPIEPSIRQFISDKQLVVLRDVKTGNALNTSYTIEGLTWTTNASGKLIFYDNAKLERMGQKIRHVNIVSNNGKPLRPSNKVYVEHFVPTNRPTVKGQVAEYTWTDKAYRCLYHTV